MTTYLITAAVTNILCPKLITDSVVSLSSKLISSIYNIVLISNDVELEKLLISSDIIQDIEVINSFIKEKYKNIDNQSILTCLNNLNKTLIDIKSNIDSIKLKIELHKKMWFSTFRNYDINKEKKMITILIKQLNHRFELLVKILSVN
jgi:hypothetical protein